MAIFPYPFPARLPYPAVLHPTLPDHMQDIHALVSLSMYALYPTTPYATYLCAYVDCAVDAYPPPRRHHGKIQRGRFVIFSVVVVVVVVVVAW